MATFDPRPVENEDPWYAAWQAYQDSIEAAINANEAAASGKAEASHTHPVTELTATGRTSANFLRGDNTWATPPNTTYTAMSQAEAENAASTTARLATGQRLAQAVAKHPPAPHTHTDLHTHANKTVLDATTASFTTADETKLDGIQSGAEVNTVDPSDLANFETTTELNARDTANRSRANHTGTQAISTVTNLQTTLDGKVPTTRTVAGKALSNNITLAKADVGLSNVDNTSDANKPISTATQTALNGKSATNHTHTDLHAHANKALLDTYTQTETNLADAVSKRHTHTNSTVLANTTASFTTADETKLDNIEANADVTDAANVAAAGAMMASVITASGKGFVNHGATAATARPTGYASIEWVGSVEPTNMANGDTWIVTT